ncbi:hypothetical protein [Streptomyces sp. TLI_171]|uniref:hypothetical protein n=1 Tax=Streptomyces sp. TLI_171 TaxID=1938859 RepID=UPI000C1861D6|nr:hypothetical protein [Streptomyces sp. TLI_171]RKE18457.1 hypothetical protein BX266_1747 [Streptomyces sp. TLI_171]
MPSFDTAELLAAMDVLPHRERDALFARTVRAASRDRLDALFDELAGHGWYGRRLAAFAAVLGGRADLLGGWLADPDREVRGRAIRALRTLPVPEEAVLAAYATGSFAVRQALRQSVVRGRRTDLAARLLPVARELWGASEAAALLPGCPPELVAAELPGLALAVRSWSALGTRYPDLVLDHVERELAAWPTADRSHWWHRLGEAVLAALPLRPARVLDLLEQQPTTFLPGPLLANFGHLVRADAERATAWLADPGHPWQRWERLPSRTVLDRVAHADPPSLPALGRRWLAAPDRFADLLRAVPPGRRTAFLHGAADGLPLDAGRLTVPVLRLLPRETRWAEVRRLRAEQLAKGREERQLRPLTALLPPEEARAELLPAVRRSDAAERAEVWRHLVTVAAADPDPAAPGQLLAELRRVRNEQDPVRQAALSALSAFPADRFTDGHAPALLDLVAEALAARDCSAATRQALSALALAVLAAHPTGARPELLDFALLTVEQLTARTGSFTLPPLAGRLRRGQEREVLAALRPWLDTEQRHGRYGLLFALVRALGPRAELLPELDERLGRALRSDREQVGAEALRLWLEPRRGRTAKVLTAIGADPSAVFFGPVRSHLATVRTDLLDLVLAERPATGRFLKPGELRPLPDTHAARLWVPRQVARAAALFGAIAADTGRSRDERAAAIRLAAPLPGHGAVVLRRHLDDPDVLVAEAALGALARTDDPAAWLPDLLEHAGDDRARVAMYTASRAARLTAPARLAPLVTGLATGTTGSKVTSRKEAVRLAAAFLPPAQAAEVLAAAFHAPGQHPDVRATAAGWCQELLDAEPVWALLSEAAEAPEPQVRQAVIGLPPHLMDGRHRPRYARLVAAVATRSGQDPEAARAAIGELPAWARYVPEVAEVLPGLVTDLDNRRTWRAAARALCGLAVSGVAHPVGGAAPGSLVHRTLAALLAAGPDSAAPSTVRDLPLRQRIEALTELNARHPLVRPALLAQAEQLGGHPEAADLRAAALARVVDLAAAEFGADFARLAAALADRPVLAARLADRLADTVAGGAALPPATDAAVPAALLALLPGEGSALGLLTTALAARLGGRCVWTGGWLPLLAALRSHPEPEVRAAARQVVTVPE